MRIAHLSDPHLGIRQYHRQTANGINQREADIAGAFKGVIDDVISARPDLVIIAGDLFHSVRPTNAAIVFAFRQLQRLREALPAAPVVIVAGNHDTPRAAETGSILGLFEELDIAVIATDARRLLFPELDLSLLAVPHQALTGAERPMLRPDGDARWQVLTLHGEVEGIIRRGEGALDYGGAVISSSEINPEEWSYVALGHYHVQKELDPNYWYCGSLEYTSNNIWGEVAEEQAAGLQGKAWLLADLTSGEVTRMPVRLARRVIDLAPIDAEGLDAKELDGYIARSIESVEGGIAGQIVRQVVYDVPRMVAREIDHQRVRAWKAEALHFHLDLRRPIVNPSAGVGAPGKRQTLPDLVRDWLGRRILPGDIDRGQFVARGVDLVERAETEGAD